MDIGDASNYVNIMMTTGEFLPGMAALRIAPPTALGINGQPTWNPPGQLPPRFSLMWTDRDTPPQVFTDGPEGAIVQGPRNAINSRTIVYLVVGTVQTQGPAGTRPRVTERTVILDMYFDVDEACHVASMFAQEQIEVAHNAGADDARFIVVDERRVMIQRHELWFVPTEGFSLGAYSSCIPLCVHPPDVTPITP